MRGHYEIHHLNSETPLCVQALLLTRPIFPPRTSYPASYPPIPDPMASNRGVSPGRLPIPLESSSQPNMQSKCNSNPTPTPFITHHSPTPHNHPIVFSCIVTPASPWLPFFLILSPSLSSSAPPTLCISLGALTASATLL